MQQSGMNVNVYRKYVPHWWNAVFCFPDGWAAAAGVSVSDPSLEHLENLAEVLKLYVPVLKADGLQAIRDYAEKIKTALAEDTSIPEQLRIHAEAVVQYLLSCVDQYGQVGDFILADAVERLAATVVRVAASSNDKSRWRTAMDTFVWPFMVNVLAAIPGQALTLLALGSGH